MTLRPILILALVPAMAGCAMLRPAATAPDPGPEVQAVLADTPRPAARPGAQPALRPPAGARTAEALDTTTPEQREAALRPAAGGRVLGRTIASLGDPTEPGFWLLTPLVSAAAPGRVRSAAGAAVGVELRPSGGAPGSGSRLSLAAFRALELGLTDLPELEVLAE